MNNKSNNAAFRNRKAPVNCIDCYRLEEGIRLPELSRILGSASYHSAKTVCTSAHSSEKLVRILADREDLSVSEFLLRYTPARKDAA